MTLKLFISHSSHNKKSRKLRDAVAKHLDEQPGIEVLWDQDIKPGDRWRAKLDKWLAECNGGVVLFSQDAIDSSWVLKEAQILTWRKAVVEHFPLIPVLLDPVDAKQTGLAKWQPVRVNEIQFIRGADPESMSDKARIKLAKDIAKAVKAQAGSTDFDSVDDPLAEWLENLADDLSNAGAKRLKMAALGLGLSAGAAPSDDAKAWAWLVARRLLHFGSTPPVVADAAKETFDAAVGELRKIVRTFGAEARERIANQFFPVWVNPDAARHICPSGQAGVPVGINATYLETGEHYLDRATFGMASENNVIVSVPDTHDGDPDGIWRLYHSELKRKFGLDDVEPKDWSDPKQVELWKRELNGVIDMRGPIFIILFGDGCARSVVDKMRDRYSPFYLILMLGMRATDTAELKLGEIRLLEPHLPVGRERQVRTLYDWLV